MTQTSLGKSFANASHTGDVYYVKLVRPEKKDQERACEKVTPPYKKLVLLRLGFIRLSSPSRALISFKTV